MTSKTLVRSSEVVAKQEQALLDLLAAIESAEDLDDLTEARARVEAVRAWAPSLCRACRAGATMAHFDNMIALRYAQWKQDRAALQRLEEAAQKLKGVPGGENPSTRIGDLLAKSLRQT